jgi:uncharacterized membrane protein (DUF485 family)
MDAVTLAQIKNNPAFRQLERKRSVFSWSLAAVMFAVYMGFILLVAFDHALVAQQIGSGPLTLAFPLGLGVIVLAILLTGVYVVRANTEFDRLTREIIHGRQHTPPPVGARKLEGVL